MAQGGSCPPLAGADLLLKEGQGLIQAHALALLQVGLPHELRHDAQDEVGPMPRSQQRCLLIRIQRPLRDGCDRQSDTQQAPQTKHYSIKVTAKTCRAATGRVLPGTSGASHDLQVSAAEQNTPPRLSTRALCHTRRGLVRQSSVTGAIPFTAVSMGMTGPVVEHLMQA